MKSDQVYKYENSKPYGNSYQAKFEVLTSITLSAATQLGVIYRKGTFSCVLAERLCDIIASQANASPSKVLAAS